MTPWLGRSGRGEAPTIAIVRASRRISAALRTSVHLPEPPPREREPDERTRDEGAGRDHRPRRGQPGDPRPDREADRHQAEAAEEVEADHAGEQVLGDEFLQHRLPNRDPEGEARAAYDGEHRSEPEPRRERDPRDREAVHEPDDVGDHASLAARLELAEGERPEDRADSERRRQEPVGADAAVEVLVDELRQQDLLRRVLERDDDAEEGDRHPEPRDARDVACRLADLAQRPLSRRGLDRPWAGAVDERGGDEERERVEGEDDGRAAAAVDEGRERRPDHDASPAGDPHQAVRRRERRLLTTSGTIPPTAG